MDKESEAQTSYQLPKFTVRYRTENWGFCSSKLVFSSLYLYKSKCFSSCLRIDAAIFAMLVLSLGSRSLQSYLS